MMTGGPNQGRRHLWQFDRGWAQRGSNPRPLVCKTRALPLSYTPEYRWPGDNPGPPERLEKFIVSDL